ncbi:MAG: hypothetical protein BWK79_09725 [Beggiatoa sp. IS2]|nr:MAG: hypothetical protein BWK79_09725 [Beggiatoa sp. IS2]
MNGFFTKIEINAPISEVWHVLADFQSYPHWNPLIYKVEGHLRTGSKIRLFVNMPYGIKSSFQVTLVKVEPVKELRWLGRLVETEFLMSGDHFFILEAINQETTQFIHGENLQGLISPVFMYLLGNPMHQSYVEFNKAIKQRCER